MEVYDGTRKNEIFRKFGRKTPMLELVFDYKGEEKRIFVKNESYNLTGSIKDRMAFYTLKKAYEKGKIKKRAAIVEATSGNTGIAFSAMGAILGHKVYIQLIQKITKLDHNLKMVIFLRLNLYNNF